MIANVNQRLIRAITALVLIRLRLVVFFFVLKRVVLVIHRSEAVGFRTHVM